MSDAKTKPPSRPTAMDYRRRVCRAMNFISRNLERDLSLEEIAASASFSSFHFHRIFKAVVSETVAVFTRRLRLEMAANHLIAGGDDDITTIAFDCGFSSSQNFAKAFRQHFGTSPSAYREAKTDRKKGHMIRKDGNALSLKTVHDPDTAYAALPTIERRITMNAEVKEMPDYFVAYARKMGPYGKETCEQAFGELMQWAGPRGHAQSGTMMGVYWDNPEVTPPERCRVDACITVPEGTVPDAPVATQTLKGGSYAVCHIETSCDNFQQAWDDAFAWLVESGRECADQPCYEIYHSMPDCDSGGKWVFDICIPLRA